MAAAAGAAAPGGGTPGRREAAGRGPTAAPEASGAAVTERGVTKPADELPNWVESLGHAAAGGAAGVVSMGIIYPIDTVKTRLQLEMPPIPQGVRGMALVRALYAGLPLGLLETGSVHGAGFLTYEFVKGLWVRATLGRALRPGEPSPVPPLPTHVLLGCAASFITQTACLPLKVVLIRVQAGKAAGLAAGARQVYAEGGVGGFFAGFRAGVAMMCNPALTFLAYERICRALRRRRARGRASSAGGDAEPAVGTATGAEQLVAGFAAKALATTLTFPLQKTQTMVQGSKEFRGSQLAALRALIALGGLAALWRGLVPKLAQAALQQALIFRFKEPWSAALLRLLLRRQAAARARGGGGAPARSPGPPADDPGHLG